MKTEKFKRVCSDCSHHYNDAEKLVAIHPFDQDDTVEGCPNCLAVDAAEMVCDEPGCKRIASAGFATKTGYRNTCHNHWFDANKVPDTISDGFGSEWVNRCSICGDKTLEVVRPGKVQCQKCG